MRRLLVLAFSLLAVACGPAPSTAPEVVATTAPEMATTTTVAALDTTTTIVTTAAAPTPAVRTGSAVLVDSGFAHIDGKRVGLIAHQVSVVDGAHLGDLLHAAPNVELAAMFGPEHGVRGDADAGEYVDDAIDPATGVPVYSLFGPTRQPTPEMLADIDVLIYDLQDVGTRYYTYISTMGLAMQAAADAGIEFVVLDRPNPQGASRTGGDTLVEENTSFVGMYPIPDLYGLTVGQLADVLVSGQLGAGYERVDLHVIHMENWSGSMIWDDTGLPWIAPSPALDTTTAAYLYPATVYFEATNLSYGRGTEAPFQTLGAPWLDAEQVAETLNSRADIRGVRFVPTTIRPEMLPGMTVEPAYLGETIPAIAFTELDPYVFEPTPVAVHLLDVLAQHGSEQGVDILERPEWLDLLSGTDVLRRGLFENGDSAEDVIAARGAIIGSLRTPHLIERSDRLCSARELRR